MATPINKLLKFLKISDEDEEEVSEDIDVYNDDEDNMTSRRQDERSSGGLTSVGKGRSSEPSFRSRQPRSDRPSQKNLVPYRPGKNKGSLEVCIHKPEQFNDAADICNLLIDGRPVIVNLEGFDSYEAQRIMDFICGCIHALDGSLRQISKYIFIFSPYDVEISGDITFDVNGVPIFKKNY